MQNMWREFQIELKHSGEKFRVVARTLEDACDLIHVHANISVKEKDYLGPNLSAHKAYLLEWQDACSELTSEMIPMEG